MSDIGVENSNLVLGWYRMVVVVIRKGLHKPFVSPVQYKFNKGFGVTAILDASAIHMM